ncbi:MAG: sulfotransferase domain-containing protein [Ginsengibacter sp.]
MENTGSFSARELNSWIPWRVSDSLCEWLYVGHKKFTEPFFTDTISACRNMDENRQPYKVISDLQIMAKWAEDIKALPPTAIIFHVSRCGSTLLSQLLALDEKHIVLSEVPFFDELLRLPFKENPGKAKFAHDYLAAAIKYYGRKRTGKEEHLFIKTDSWHLHFYEQLRNLFPSVPCILLYRNPLEVMFSQKRQRGMQSVPGMIEPEVFGLSRQQLNETNLDAYMATILENYYKKIIEIITMDPLTLPVNYKEGIKNIMSKVYAFLGMELTEKTEILFKERSRFHAKHPQHVFEEAYEEFSKSGHMEPVMRLYNNLEEMPLLKPML